MNPSENSTPETLHDWLQFIQANWELTDAQMAGLAQVGEAQYRNWFSAEIKDSTATVPPGMETAVPLVSIYRRLAARFSNTEDQIKWLFTAHKDFGNHKPIDIATSSLTNLSWVSYYLETARPDEQI